MRMIRCLICVTIAIGFLSVSRDALGFFKFDGMTPLHQACVAGNVKRVRELLRRGAQTSMPRPNIKVTPLSIACELGHFEIVRLLCDADVDLEVKLSGGETPLMIAARAGHAQVG